MCTVEPIRQIKDIRKVMEILRTQSFRNLLIFTIGVNCGLRISDILALDVRDVRNKDYIELYERKTGKYKKIPINPKLRYMIQKYTMRRRASSPLFVSKRNRRLDRIMAWRIIKDACIQAGIVEHVGTHTLRKTFGYHHYQRFNNLAMLQKMFNHSSISITLRYIGISQEEMYYSYNNFVI